MICYAAVDSVTVGEGQSYCSFITVTGKESMGCCAPDRPCLHPEATDETSTHILLDKATHIAIPIFKEVMSRKERTWVMSGTPLLPARGAGEA